MSSFRVRPRFVHTVELSLPDTQARLLDALPLHQPSIEVRSFPDFIALHIPEAERRFWSPRLFLNLEATKDGRTRIHGIYGPETEVWSLFLYGYLMTGLLGSFSAILGSAQLFVGAYAWGFYITGGMALLATLLYLFAQLGQKLGAWQTFQLHQAYQAAIGEPAAVT